MTHFATLVIVPNTDRDKVERAVSDLLAPFDENSPVEEYTDEDGDTWMHNPKAKWDWWVVGGRWPNKLLTRPGAEVVNPEPSVFGSDWDGVRTSGARKRDVDWEKLAEVTLAGRQKAWDELQVDTHFRGMNPGQREFIYGVKPDDDRDSYAMRGVRFSIGAILTPDGEWHEQGAYGWWGHQDEGIGEEAWRAETKRIIDEADDDDWFVIVDCHI